MIKVTRKNLQKPLTEEDSFSLKIIADRYLLKDTEKVPTKDDVAVVELEVVDSDGNPQRDEKGEVKTVKEVALVDSYNAESDTVTVTLFTGGDDRGKQFTVKRSMIDILLERDVEDLKNRLAKALSGGDKKLEKEIRERSMTKLLFGGRILAGAGTDEELTYFNCYVAPPIHDSRAGIAKHREIVMEIMSRGGGVGTNGSTLRPAKTKVHKVRGRSSGAVSWLHDLSELTHLVSQGGTRRGAQMITLADWHPDLIEFITAKAQKPLECEITINGEKKLIKFGKRGNQRLTGANISVLISNKFMEAYKNDEEWELVFPDIASYTPEQMEIYDREWHLIGDPWKFQEKTGLPLKVYSRIPARDIVKLISVAMHGSAEPGVIFIDRYNEYSNSWYYNPIICTNPCGEQGLPAWGVCNLGHVNLAQHVKWNEKKKRFEADLEDIKQTTRVLVRALDNVIDATPYFFKENEENQKAERRLGLGTMGIDELLKLEGLDYGTQEGRDRAEQIFELITITAYKESIELAKEKGAFKKFDAEKFIQSKFMQFLGSKHPEIIEGIKKYGIRNVTLITQAPTGTTGTLAQTSTGIEPFYAGEFWRNSRIGLTVQKAPVIKRMEAHGMDTSGLKYAGDYTTKQHLDFQAVAQRWCDSSISKTINAPRTTTVADVSDLIEYAYDIGLKGFTIYVDGSREEQILGTDETHKAKEEKKEFKRDSYLTGRTHMINTSYGRLYVTFNRDKEGKLREVFFNIGKAGSDTLATLEGYGRLLSLMLQNSDITEEQIIKQLRGIVGSNPYGFGENRVSSIPDAIALAFQRELEVYNPKAEKVTVKGKDLCTCGAPMIWEEGCFKCQACGFSKCG
jgi:ribonucleoside-diphosphate reductase alpha chain